MRTQYRPCYLLFILLFTVYSSALFAQGENNNWHFGQKLSINFNVSPAQLVESNIRSTEGCSSVSDAAGNLLFYTIGSRIWDRNGNAMPNSNGLLGNGPLYQGVPVGSSANGVAIIKNPGNANQYYVFSGDALEDATYKLYYSLVDMTLNGGLGDVVPTVKNVLLMNNVYEYLTTTRGGDCKSYWLLARTSNIMTREYYAFKVDATGVSATPVITTGPTNTIGAIPHMCFAPDGVTLASAGLKLHLAKFNNLTGVITDFVPIDSVPMGPVAFSADGTKLYTAVNNLGVKQVDLSLMPNTVAVANSVINVDSNPNPNGNIFYYDVRLAPNNKIYVVRNLFNSSGFNITLSVVNNPNVAGSGCNFVTSAFNMPVPWVPAPPLNSFFALGNSVVANPPIDTVYHPAKDTMICSGNTFQLKASDDDAAIYEWNTGATTATINVSQGGLYWVKSISNCITTLDSFRIAFADIAIDLGNDTSICTGTSITLDASHPDIDSWQWNNGSTASTLDVTQAGTYYVRGTLKACFVSDTIKIALIVPSLRILEADTLICNDQPLVLHTIANPVSHYTWSNGEHTDQITVSTAGTYTVKAMNECGTFTDSVKIEVQNCDCKLSVPNAFTPNGDGANDVLDIQLACVPKTYSINIFNRFGQRVFQGSKVTDTWDGTFNGKTLDVGAYFYYITFTSPTGTKFQRKGDLTLMR